MDSAAPLSHVDWLRWFEAVKNAIENPIAINYQQLTMPTGRLLGRTSAGTGPVESISVTAPLTLAAGALGITGSALTRVNDTNVTATLTGTPATALLASVEITLGWTGTLAVTRGGTGLSAVATGDLLYGSASNVLSRRAIGSTANVLTVSGGLPVWAAPAASATAVIVDDTTTNASMFPTWVTASSGSLPLKVSSTKLFFNPSTSETTIGNQTGSVYAVHIRGDNNALTTYPGLRTGGGGSIVLEANAAAGGKVFLAVDNAAPVSIAAGGGNVGIGTTSPGEALDVVGSKIRLLSNPVEFLIGGAAGSTALNFVNDGSSPRVVTAAGLPFYIGVFGLALSTATKWDSANNFDIATQKLYVNITSGNVGIGTGTTPSAGLHIKAGAAAASSAPLKFTSGTNLTTAEAGAMEYNGTNLFFTRAGTVRENVLVAIDNVTAPGTSIGVGIVNYYGSAATNFLGDPNRWLSVNVLGATYKIPLYT